MKSRKNHFIHRPESQHHAIKRGRATDEPTDQTAEPHLSNNTPRQSFQPVKPGTAKPGTVHLGENAKPGTIHFVEEERIHALKMQL